MFKVWICLTCGRRVDEADALKSLACPSCSGPVAVLEADSRDELVTAAERLRRDVVHRNAERDRMKLPARMPTGKAGMP